MNNLFTFTTLLSEEDRSLFDDYYYELHTLDQDFLLSAVRTGKVLRRIEGILLESRGWEEFVEKGLPANINEELANCLINLTGLYNRFELLFIEELYGLSIQSLLYISHPVVSWKTKLFLLSTAKEINLENKSGSLNQMPITLKEFELFICTNFKIELVNHGILGERLNAVLEAIAVNN